MLEVHIYTPQHKLLCHLNIWNTSLWSDPGRIPDINNDCWLTKYRDAHLFKHAHLFSVIWYTPLSGSLTPAGYYHACVSSKFLHTDFRRSLGLNGNFQYSPWARLTNPFKRASFKEKYSSIPSYLGNQTLEIPGFGWMDGKNIRACFLVRVGLTD